MSGESRTGFFGKVPALGDFVQRRMPKDFVDSWDGWLQQAVAASKSRLGEGWLQTYLSSPLWRFVLGRNVCGANPWAGVLMPSVDRVGRYFPLTIAVPLAEDAAVFQVVRQPGWFEKAEALALSALEEQGFSLDTFSEQVAGLGDCTAPGAFAGDVMQEFGVGWHAGLDSVSDVDDGLLAMLEQLANDRFVSCCLWWTDGSDHVAPSLLFSPGLPEPDSYTGLLDGRFHDWSWTALGEAPPAAVEPADPAEPHSLSDLLENP